MDNSPSGPPDESRPDSPGTPDTPDDGASGERHVPYLPPRSPEESAPAASPLRRGWWLAAAAVVVLALVVFVLVPLLTAPREEGSGESMESAPAVSRNAEPGLDGIVAREVPPAQIHPGDCLTDVDSVSEPSTVVECSRDHEAQLVGRKLWPTGRAFPQDMRADAERFCATIELDSAEDAQVVVEISHPAEGTWAEGDRRVDCLAVAHEGTLSTTLVAEPAFEDWTDHQDD
ncbi:hypothetical protein [Citricoccus nitrophenolicus]|uniref:hypothetical protein n=1 Tax=Citricoccus nitrophenolicus TaxID=863575 RepID=UPI0031E84A84